MLIITTQSEELEIIFSSQGMSNAIDCCPYMGNLENIRTLIWRVLQLKFVPLRDNEDCCLCHSWARMVVSLFRPRHQLLLRSKNPSVVIINQMLPKPHVTHYLCCTWTQLIFWCFPYHWSNMMIVEKCMENMELLISSSMVSSEEKPEIIQTTKYTLLAHFWCPLEECNWTKVLLMVICPPLVVSLLRMWFTGHSLPLQADSIFSKQVRDNRENKFGYFWIDLSKFLTVWLTMLCCTLKH